MDIYAHRKKNPKNNEYIYESLDVHEELLKLFYSSDVGLMNSNTSIEYKNDVRVTPELTVNNTEIFQFLVEKDFNSYYYKILNYLNTKPEFKEFYKFLEKYEFIKLIENDSENIFILSEENREILDEYEKIYKDFDMEFYKKQILLKNLRVKIYEDSITIYPGDKRMEKVQEKAKIKYLEG